MDGALTLGAGIGVYIAIDTHDVPEPDTKKDVAGLITMSASYRLGFAPVSLRASWNRTVTSYDRDTDVIMGGLGWYF